jgi:hypothetical protein
MVKMDGSLNFLCTEVQITHNDAIIEIRRQISLDFCQNVTSWNYF